VSALCAVAVVWRELVWSVTNCSSRLLRRTDVGCIGCHEMKLWKQFSNCLMTRKEEETRRFARGTVHYGSTRGGRIFEEAAFGGAPCKKGIVA